MTVKSQTGPLVLLTALCLVSSAAFLDVFSASDVGLILVLAAAAPVVIATALRKVRPRPHAAWSALASGLGAIVALLLVVATRSGSVSGGGWVRVPLEGMTSGWADVLAATVPAPGRAELLVVPLVVVWVCSAVAVEMCFRTRLVLSVLAPTVVCWAAGLLLSSGAGASWLLLPTLYLAIAAAWVVVRVRDLGVHLVAPDQRDARSLSSVDANTPGEIRRSVAAQRWLAALPAIAIVALVAALVASAAPFVDSSDPVLLREAYEPGEQLQVDLSPLATVGSAAKNSDNVAFSVEVDRVPEAPLRMRVEVLDQFDGVRWTSASEFVEAGSSVPPVDGSEPVRSTEVRQQVELRDYDSQFLPAANRPVKLEAPLAAGVRVDPVTGVLVVTDPEAAEGLSYEVTSLVPVTDGEVLPNSGVGTGPDAKRAVDFSYQLPPQATEVGSAVMSSASTPFEQVALLMAFFGNDERVDDPSKHDFEVDPTRPTQLSADRISSFIVGAEPADRVGPPQLFAAAFTALARSRGLPVRIAVGYDLGQELRPGTPVEVGPAQLTAWSEVAFDGAGWVAFEPGPDSTDAPPPPEEEQINAAVEEASGQNQSNPDGPGPENPNAGNGDETSGIPGWAVFVFLVVVACGAAVAIPVVAKARRRRQRRHAATPAERVTGAWQELIDRFVERGLTGREEMTPRDVASVSGSMVDGDPVPEVQPLGELVDRAIHAEEQPDDADALRAWELVDGASRRIRSQESMGRKAKAAVSTRPLVGTERSSS